MDIIAGCLLPVQKSDGIYHQAEVLSIRIIDDIKQYYVHYQGFNKRLDEWVSEDRVDSTQVQQPKVQTKVQPPPKSAKKSKKASKKSIDKKRKRISSTVTVDESATSSVKDEEEKVEQPPEEEEEEGFSKMKELEKLRTSGSMTQSLSEIARVKNIKKIQFGKHRIETWYFSSYPEEYAKLDVLCICEFCLEAVGTENQLSRHCSKCKLRHPPGNEIYRHENISFFEIDGKDQRRYTRNLCLLSKLFLDHKTLYYDVDPFLFYLMTQNDEAGHHLIGYFSKEKYSSEEYNVACILTLPQFQRMGYGKLQIEFSYELSKLEKKLGSPEKPLSDLGLLSYRSFWADTILDLLCTHFDGLGNGEISIAEIAELTSFTTDDIMHTLHALDLLKYYKGGFILCLSDKHLEMYQKNRLKTEQGKRRRIVSEMIQWTPPKFLPSELRYL